MSKATEDAGADIDYARLEGGGITSPRGFRASGIHAGFKKVKDRLDMALLIADRACATAGVFTQNVFCAAPVIVSREHLNGVSFGKSRAVIINSGNANAATGTVGLETARNTAATAARLIGCTAQEVLVSSTGVIGVPIPAVLFEEGLPPLIESADNEGGKRAAQAIMTTDTHPKEYAVSYRSADPDYEGVEFRVGGMAKGSGMIMPDMATLIAILTTDVPLSSEMAHEALLQAVGNSFNKVSVDSDTSTNDTCILMASGQALPADSVQEVFARDSVAYNEFIAALELVCIGLARMIAADGEGATKLITVSVSGAADDGDADKAARAIANSPLVKTAIFGHDANWGRVAMAVGKSGASFMQERVSIDFLGLPVCRKGLPVPFDEEKALELFKATEVEIAVDLGAGSAQTTIWTCDYSHDYITINGDYRT